MSLSRITAAGLAWLAANGACLASEHVATVIPPLVISATRTAQSEVTTPSSITVIDRAAIEASGARHLVDVLRGQGLLQLHDLFGDGSRMTVGLRGFGVNGAHNTLVLVDGRRLNNTDIAPPDLNSIALEDIEQVEIIQGSAAVLYGDQAVGGVINIVTRAVQARRGRVAFSYGSHADRDLRASGSQRFANGTGLKASAQWRKSKNYRSNNDQSYTYASLLADHEAHGRRWFVEQQFSSEKLGLPGELSAAEVAAERRQTTKPLDFIDTDNAVTRLGYRAPLGDAWRLETELAYRRTDSDGEQFFFGDLTHIAQERRHLAFTPRVIGTLPLFGEEALLITGLDFNRADYGIDSASSNSQFAQDADQDLMAGYLQATLPFGERLTGTLGARVARVDNAIFEYNEFFGFVQTQQIDDEQRASAFEVGLAWRPHTELRLFTRYDTPYRFAKVDENAYTSFGVDTLEVQTGHAVEAGVEWGRGQLFLKALAYRLDLDDEIGYDPSALDPTGFGNFGANINFAPTRRDGLLLEGRAGLADGILLSGQVSVLDARFRSGPYDGKTVPMVAERSARLAIEMHPGAHWNLFVEGIYTGPRYLDGDFANSRRRLGGHTVANAHVRYQRGAWAASLRIDNLGGKQFSDYGSYNTFTLADSFYPAPERRLHLALELRLE